MRYFGAVLSFILRDHAAAETFLANSKLLTEATSFGGITTTAERRARWGGDAIAEGFIRLSAGCEAIEDLIEDMAQALDATAMTRIRQNWTRRDPDQAAADRARPPVHLPAADRGRRGRTGPRRTATHGPPRNRRSLPRHLRPRLHRSRRCPPASSPAPTRRRCAPSPAATPTSSIQPSPERSTHIALKPVVEVRVLPEQNLLLFIGFHTIVAWGEQGLAWQTAKLSWEGLRITGIEGNTLHGFGWNLMTDKEVAFSVDLLTGQHQGGGFRSAAAEAKKAERRIALLQQPRMFERTIARRRASPCCCAPQSPAHPAQAARAHVRCPESSASPHTPPQPRTADRDTTRSTGCASLPSRCSIAPTPRGSTVKPLRDLQRRKIRPKRRQRRIGILGKPDMRRTTAERLDPNRARACIQIDKAAALEPRRKNVEQRLAQPVARRPRLHPTRSRQQPRAICPCNNAHLPMVSATRQRIQW